MKVPAALSARLTRLRRPITDDGSAGVTAPARSDRRTKDLTKRLRPGDIAIIDHVDIDRVSAEALLERGVSAVVNVATSISGRYPNLGPGLIVEAGVPLVDDVDPEVFARVHDGEELRLEGGTLYRGDEVLAKGVVQNTDSVAAAMAEARAGLSVQLEAFAANTMEYLKRERELLFDGVGIPDLRTDIDGRHVLIVVRGYHYREDISTLRSYIREYRPVMIGVDGGADALLEAGYRPDIIVGDFDSVSDRALATGAELVVHAYRDGRAPGLKRLTDLGYEPVVFPATGTSEDVAMMLADDSGATLIVAVGTHATLEEFLDKGRAGMASTFLTRLRVGGKLVDAKGVSRLYRSRISPWALLALVAASLLTVLVAAYSSPAGQVYLTSLAARWDALVYWLTGLFT
ncbi:putative membrane-anchored protein [Nocardiopsis mwathae]|uniref:Putative membrane-anchored protein n=1 Tax=Nocardiopsis mwathae TaxID=1472723 RepID=A0A7X0D4T3_9ACTN|nr:putative cytokinetic ring protein SteA [Nocardiopsis mwathae]MBB6171111.1 putative membrane-anchored protein [Nocardiopsis mwathae]